MITTFKLTEADAPHVALLERRSRKQYNLLMASCRVPAPSYVDLVEEFKIAPGTVKSRLHRARQNIIRWRKQEENHEQTHRGNEEV